MPVNNHIQIFQNIQYIKEDRMRLVKATMNNALDFLQFKNDPDTRKFSIISNELITWSDHLAWMQARLRKPGFYAIMFGPNCIGDLRFDFGEEIEVSIRLDKNYRNKGLGTEVLERAIEMHSPLIAKILIENIASYKLFTNTGFVVTANCQENGINYWLLKRG